MIAPGLLGRGHSTKPRTDYSLGAFAAGLRDLFDELGISRATIVGHSLGRGRHAVPLPASRVLPATDPGQQRWTRARRGVDPAAAGRTGSRTRAGPDRAESGSYDVTDIATTSQRCGVPLLATYFTLPLAASSVIPRTSGFGTRHHCATHQPCASLAVG